MNKLQIVLAIAAIVSSLAALTSAFVGPFVSLHIAKKQLRSKNALDWIAAFQDSLSRLLSTMGTLCTILSIEDKDHVEASHYRMEEAVLVSAANVVFLLDESVPEEKRLADYIINATSVISTAAQGDGSQLNSWISVLTRDGKKIIAMRRSLLSQESSQKQPTPKQEQSD